MNPLTPEQIKSTMDTLRALADAIKELKQVPSGILYSQVMGYMSLGTYERCIGVLKCAGVVTESNHMLTWVEPKPLKPEEHNAFPNGRW